jgi:hypothetical protein
LAGHYAQRWQHINKAIHESGRAAMPLENELLEEVLKSELLHADETPWKQKGDLLWLWIFVICSVVTFWIYFARSQLRILKSAETRISQGFFGIHFPQT